MVSVYDVAQRAGVSPATASRVLSGSSYPVRARTRERVLRSARILDFRPSMVARALVTARTRTLGAIVHDVSDPYFGEVLRGLEGAAHANGYQMFVCSSNRETQRELAYVRSLLSYRVDAILFCGGGIDDRRYGTELRRLLDGYRKTGGAVVTLAPHGYRAPSVTADNRGGAVAMARHLLDLGHRRLGVVAGPASIRTGTVRVAGFRAALAERGVALAPDLIVSGEFTAEGGAAAVSRLLDRDPAITAVLCANDVMAFGVLHELAGRGIRVPQTVSVAGFGDVRMAAYTNPPLSTVAVPRYEIGWQGVHAALALLAGEPVRSRRLPVSVVARASTGRVPERTASGRREQRRRAG